MLISANEKESCYVFERFPSVMPRGLACACREMISDYKFPSRAPFADNRAGCKTDS